MKYVFRIFKLINNIYTSPPPEKERERKTYCKAMPLARHISFKRTTCLLYCKKQEFYGKTLKKHLLEITR